MVLIPDVRSSFSFAFSLLFLFSDCQCLSSFVFLVIDEVSCDLEI
jgi:hypothetical protein